MEDRPRFRTGPEKLGRPGLSGGLGKRGLRRRARALSQQPTSEAWQASVLRLRRLSIPMKSYMIWAVGQVGQFRIAQKSK
jgi:hypothetical protein